MKSNSFVGRIVFAKTSGLAPKPTRYLVLGRLLLTALEMAFEITLGSESILEEYCLRIPDAALLACSLSFVSAILGRLFQVISCDKSPVGFDPTGFDQGYLDSKIGCFHS